MEVKATGNATKYRWQNCVAGFNMPVKLTDGTWIQPTGTWKEIKKKIKEMQVDKNFYINMDNQ